MTAEAHVLDLLEQAQPILAAIAARNLETVRYFLAKGWSPERICAELYCVRLEGKR